MRIKIRTYPIEEMYPPIVVPVCTTFKPTEFETSLCLRIIERKAPVFRQGI